ncbi:MAG: glycoside hydrolase family 15 protein, partial [Geminicoccaceae bacterium]
ALLSRGVRDGAFTKHEGAGTVDANLLFLAVPEAVVPLDEPLFGRTLARIEGELVHGGVHRYRADSFYGGGEWIVLTGFLGWCYARLGRRADAERCLAWIADQADPQGHLPEQVPHCLYDPAMLPVWERRWGRVATPLLWSHAMYLILADELSASAT